MISFFQSWASLVNREALDGIPGQERKRQEVGTYIKCTLSALIRNCSTYRRSSS